MPPLFRGPFGCVKQKTGATNLAPIANLSRPGYLVRTVIEPFGTIIRRVTNLAGTAFSSPISGKWGTDTRHNYSTNTAWNCDQSLLYIENKKGGASPSQLYLDGTTYAILYGTPSNLPGGGGNDQRWHPALAHKNEVIVAGGSSGPTLWWFDVTTNAITRSWTLPIGTNYIGMTDGQASADGRYLALGSTTQVFIIDMETWPTVRTGAIFNFTTEGLGGVVTHYSVSPSGQYLIVAYSDESKRMFDIDPSTLNLSVHVTTGPLGSASPQFTNAQGAIYAQGHTDYAVDIDGTEWIVGQEHASPSNVGAHVSGVTEVSGNGLGHVLAIRIPDGAGRSLTDPTIEAYAYHISCRCVQRPGWAYVSFFNDSGSDLRFKDEIIAVRIDGSGQCERYGWTHSNSTSDDGSCVGGFSDFLYRSEPHPCPTPDGKRIIFASNFHYRGTSSDCSVASYVISCK